MAQSANPPQGSPDIKPGERYKYIGFEVYPNTTERFWQSDAEAQKFATQVHSGDVEALLHRDFSLLETQAMGAADRWVLTITGAIMLITTAMPWVSYRNATGAEVSMGWVSTLGAVFGGLGSAFSGGVALGLSAFFALVVLLGTPIIGAWVLAMLWTKAKTPESYQLHLRLPLKLGYVVLLSGLAALVLSFFGGDLAGYASWGLIEQPERYGIAALLKVLSFGPYIALGMAMICGVKSGDL